MREIRVKDIYRLNNKRGISLLVLIITIVVALIIIATAVLSTDRAIENATVTTFAKDLTDIEDATQSYYITNGTMPSIDGTTVMTSNDLIAMSSNADILTSEITENSDTAAQFYQIDLAKINVTKTTYGNKVQGASDVFVVSFPNLIAYYPYGVLAKGTTYFSITSKLSDITRIAQNPTDISSTSVISSGGISVTKNNGWANKMGVNIQVDMATDETLYMSVSSDVNRLITTATGPNNFGFDLLSAIVAGNETIKVPTLTITEANYIEAGTKPIDQRYVDILKYKGTELIGRVRIDLSNFSNAAPTINSATATSYTDINTIKLTFANSQSGIQEVRYEFLTKYTENGTIDNYYTNVTDFDVTYMKNQAKISPIANDLTTTISAAKNVQSIKVAVIDKAGNVNLYNQVIAPSLYIGYSVDSNTTSSMQLTAKVYSYNGVKSITFERSEDGVNFVDLQTFTMNTTIKGTTSQQCAPYTTFTSNVQYVRITAVNYDNSLTESRMITVNLLYAANNLINKPVLAVGMSAKDWDDLTNSWVTVSNPTANTNWYNYKSGKWANAQTLDGSMWVWIPRYIYKISTLWHTASSIGGTINIQFSKETDDNWNSSKIGNIITTVDASASNNTWTNHPAFTFGTTELTGFWIAKYEASGAEGTITILPGVASLRNLSVSTIFTECRNMEKNNRYGWGTTGVGIDTHMIKNIEWGAVAYLAQSIYGLNEVEIVKNANSKYYTGGGTGNAYVTNVNQSTTGNVFGVYDMSGDAWEYTAAYINNGNTKLNQYASILVNADSMYKDVYTVTNKKDTSTQNYANSAVDKKGDALYEVSNLTGSASAWFKDNLSMPYTNNPIFTRGGSNLTSNAAAGMFASNPNTGQGSSSVSFRPVLIVNNSL